MLHARYSMHSYTLAFYTNSKYQGELMGLLDVLKIFAPLHFYYRPSDTYTLMYIKETWLTALWDVQSICHGHSWRTVVRVGVGSVRSFRWRVRSWLHAIIPMLLQGHMLRSIVGSTCTMLLVVIISAFRGSSTTITGFFTHVRRWDLMMGVVWLVINAIRSVCPLVSIHLDEFSCLVYPSTKREHLDFAEKLSANDKIWMI